MHIIHLVNPQPDSMSGSRSTTGMLCVLVLCETDAEMVVYAGMPNVGDFPACRENCDLSGKLKIRIYRRGEGEGGGVLF